MQHLIRGRVLDFHADPAETQDNHRYWEDGAIIVQDGKIVAVGDHADLARPDLPETDHRPHLILPGFIDPHIHFPQLQVIASWGAQLLDWLNTYTFPEEARFADPDHATRMAGLFLDQLTAHGTTTAVAFCSSHKTSAEALFSAAHDRDMAMVAGKVMMDRNAPDAVLDNYQQERSDHVESYIVLSMEMGKVVCILDETAAAERDAAFAAGMLPPPPIPPVLTGGLVAMQDGAVAPGAGVLMPHAMLKTPLGDVDRLDTVAGRRFFVVTRNGAAAALGDRQRATLARLDASVIEIDGAYPETDGKLAAFLDQQGADAVIARPDFHSFGVAATAAGLSDLVDDLEAALS